MSALASWLVRVIRSATRRPAEALSAVFIGMILCNIWRFRTDGLVRASSNGVSKKRKYKKISGIKIKSRADSVMVPFPGAAFGARLEESDSGNDNQSNQSEQGGRDAKKFKEDFKTASESQRNYTSTCDDDAVPCYEDQTKMANGVQSESICLGGDSKNGKSLPVYAMSEDCPDDNSDLSTKCNLSSEESESSLVGFGKYASKDKATEAWEKFFDLTGKLIQELEASVKRFRLEALEMAEEGGFDLDNSTDSVLDYKKSTVEVRSSGTNNAYFEGGNHDYKNENGKEKCETLAQKRTKSKDATSKVLSGDFEEMSNALRESFLDITKRKLLDAYEFMFENRDLGSRRSRPGMDSNNSEHEKEFCAEKTDKRDCCLEDSHKSRFLEQLDGKETESGKLELCEDRKVDFHEETRRTSNLDACDMLLSLTENLDLSHVVFNGIALYGYFATCSYRTKLFVSNLLHANSKYDAGHRNRDLSSEDKDDEDKEAFYNATWKILLDFFEMNKDLSALELLKEGLKLLDCHIPTSDARQGKIEEYREPEFQYLLDDVDDSGEFQCLLESSIEEPNETEENETEDANDDGIKSCTISSYKLSAVVEDNSSISSLDNDLEDQEESKDFEVTTVRLTPADLLGLEAESPLEIKDPFDPFRPLSNSPKVERGSSEKSPSLGFEDSFMMNSAVSDGTKSIRRDESIISKADDGVLNTDVSFVHVGCLKDSGKLLKNGCLEDSLERNKDESCIKATDLKTEVIKCNEESFPVESLRADPERLTTDAKAQNVGGKGFEADKDGDDDDEDDDDIKKGNLPLDLSGGKEGQNKGLQKDENSPEEQPGGKDESGQSSGGSGSSGGGGGGEDRKGDENSEGKKQKEESSDDEEDEDMSQDDEADDKKNEESPELGKKVVKEETTSDKSSKPSTSSAKPEPDKIKQTESSSPSETRRDSFDKRNYSVLIKQLETPLSGNEQQQKMELEEKVSEDHGVRSEQTESSSDIEITYVKLNLPSTSSSEPGEVKGAEWSSPRKYSSAKQRYPMLVKQLESFFLDKEQQEKMEPYKKLFERAMQEVESKETERERHVFKIPKIPEKRKTPTKAVTPTIEGHSKSPEKRKTPTREVSPTIEGYPKGPIDPKKRKVTTPGKESGIPKTPPKPKNILEPFDYKKIEHLFLEPSEVDEKSRINVGASGSKTQDASQKDDPRGPTVSKKKATTPEKESGISKTSPKPKNILEPFDYKKIEHLFLEPSEVDEKSRINVGASGSKTQDASQKDDPRGPTVSKKKTTTPEKESGISKTPPKPKDILEPFAYKKIERLFSKQSGVDEMSGINVGASGSKTQDASQKDDPRGPTVSKKKPTTPEKRNYDEEKPKNCLEALNQLITKAVCSPEKINVRASGSKSKDAAIEPEDEDPSKGPTEAKKRRSSEREKVPVPLPADLPQDPLPKPDSDDEVEHKN